MNKELFMRNLGGGVNNPLVRYCLINNINPNYREPLEIHTDNQGQYILVPEPPVNTSEELLHREFIGYFGIQGLHDTAQNKITLARPALMPIASGSKYYLTELVNSQYNNILDPIGLIAVYAIKSPLLYYFTLPTMESAGTYYGEYLGHSGYSYEDNRDIYLTTEYICQLSYDSNIGSVCTIPSTMADWASMYYESAYVVGPEEPNLGTNILPFYHALNGSDSGLRIVYNTNTENLSSYSNIFIDSFDSALLDTFSMSVLSSMRIQFTVTDNTGHAQALYIYITGIEVNNILYSFKSDRPLIIPEGATQFFIYNPYTQYLRYNLLNIWPSFE